MRKKMLGLSSAVLCLLAGCQSSQSPAPQTNEAATKSEAPAAGAAPDPCKLITSQELTEVIGEAIEIIEKAPSDDPTIAQCTIDTFEFPGRMVVTVSTYVSEEDARSAFQAGGEGAEPVAGMADEAFGINEGGQFELKVRKQLLVMKLVLVTENAEGKDHLKALATKALARI